MCDSGELDLTPEDEGEEGSASQRRFAPLFILTAGIHLAALATRFQPAGALLPAWVGPALLWAHFPLFLVEGYFEGSIDYGDQRAGMPLWMQIDSRPVKLAFTFGFTYIGVVILQTWNLSIGPVNPNPPPTWPLSQRAMWFGIMTVGMFAINFMAASAIFIPLLRLVTAPFRRLPPLAALPLVTGLGVGIGYAVARLLSDQKLGSGIKGLYAAYRAQPVLMIAVTLALVLLPLLLGALRGNKDEGPAPKATKGTDD